MTEAEWLACEDPQRMLAFLQGRASDRKLRLFACACCRRVGHLLAGDWPWRWVEYAERLAEGEEARPGAVPPPGRVVATRFCKYEPAVIHAVCSTADGRMPGLSAARLASASCRDAAVRKAELDAQRTCRHATTAMRAARADELLAHTTLLGCIFGPLPFRPVTIDPAWLTWNDGTVPKLAAGIYADRAFDRPPVLADALCDAGCSDPDILGHCRGGGEHVRGCWVVDLILGKE